MQVVVAGELAEQEQQQEQPDDEQRGHLHWRREEGSDYPMREITEDADDNGEDKQVDDGHDVSPMK